MIGKDTHRTGHLLIIIVFTSGCLFYIRNGFFKQIRSVYVLGTVKKCQYPFKSPAGIYILLGKLCQLTVFMLFILHENIVSKLCIFTA